MKKIFFLFFGLAFLFCFNKNAYAVTNCSFRFLDNAAVRGDLPQQNGIATLGSTDTFNVLIYNLKASTSYRIVGLDSSGNQFTDGGGEKPSLTTSDDPSLHAVFGPINNGGKLATGSYIIRAYESSTNGDGSQCGTATLKVQESSTTNAGTCELQPRAINECSDGYGPLAQTTTDFVLCICVPDGTPGILNGFAKTTPTPTPSPREGPCLGGSCSTAFGPISTSPAGFVKSLFGILLSLAGGIAVILIIVSGYRLMSSQGNPEKVQAAREQLTSAIVGLLFIIFSITILQIIGVDILHIPGINP